VGNLFDPSSWPGEMPYAGLVLMIGRLLEVPESSAETFRQALVRVRAPILGYVYPGWSADPFKVVAARAGLELMSEPRGHVALLRVVDGTGS
jgi:hypothetical protein